MTEPKVVHAHQWDDDEGWGHLVRTDGGYYQGAEREEHEDRRYDLVDKIPLDVAIELARLAARVEELEGHAELYRELAARVDDDENSLVAEITQLREALDSIAVNAKDEFSRVTATAALEEKP